MRFSIQRYHPEQDDEPWLQDFELDPMAPGSMLLDALLALREQDEGLIFRHSCAEGVCGADGMNVNGRNALACITPLEGLGEPVVVRPLPGLPVIRDLVVDMEPFFAPYRDTHPYLLADTPVPDVERLQSPSQRAALDGAYECILCGCCTSACGSWRGDAAFPGPAALLQAWRYLADSRDDAGAERLARLAGPHGLFACHGRMDCAQVCPKGLNPALAIGLIRRRMLREGT